MKHVFRTGVVVLLLLFHASVAVAQETKMIAPLSAQAGMPPVDGGMGQLFGQNHWYSVVFRGNGEAVVSTRIVFTNSDTKSMKSLVFRVPHVKPENPLAFQVIREPRCLQYSSKTGTEFCIQYDDLDAYNWYGPAKYQKATLAYEGDTLTLTLPQPVQPDKSASILISYRAFGYAKKDIVGGWRFTFETLEASEPIQELQIGISTDSDLFLRGTKSEVNYRFEDMAVSSKGMMAQAAPVANSRMDAYWQQIGSGELIKTASNLAALESYTVRGSYADSRLKLYAKETGIGLLVIVLFAAISYFVTRRIFRANKTPQPSTGMLAVFSLSFLSALLIVGYSAVVMYIVQNISQLFGYQAQAPVMLLLLVISLGVYGLLLVAPALFLGIKRGLWYGLATAGLTLLWLILAFFLYLILNISGQNPGVYPMGMMKRLNSSVSYPEPQVAPSDGDMMPQ